MMLRSRSASCARFMPAALVILVLHACAEGPPVRQTIEPTPVPAPVADPPTPAPVPAPTPAPTPTLPTSNFHLVASTEHEFLLRRLGSKIAVVVDAALAVIDETGELGDIVRPAPDLDSHPLGIGGWHTHTIGGHWPDRTWMIANRTLTRVANVPAVYRRKGDRWVQQRNRDRADYWYWQDILTWREGQILGLRITVPDPDEAYWDEIWAERQAEVDLEEGRTPDEPDSAPVFDSKARFELLGDKIRRAPFKLARGLRVVVAAVAPTGELFVIGWRGDPEQPSAVVQRWRPDGPFKGELHDFGTDVRLDRLAVGAGDDAYVGGTQGDGERAWLARFDGVSWSEVPAPSGREVRDLAVTGDGALWAVVNLEAGEYLTSESVPTALLRRPAAQAAWEPVLMPELALAPASWWSYSIGGAPRRATERTEATGGPQPVKPRGVFAGTAGDVWVTGGLGDWDLGGQVVSSHAVLLHDRPPTRPVVRFPDSDEQVDAILDAPLVRASGRPCAHGSLDFAVFVDLAPETGADAPIPALEAFVRDHPEHASTLDAICEVERDGQRRIALFTTYKTSKSDLLAALDRAVPGPRHAFWCGRPPVRRCFDKQDGTPTP